MMRFPEPARVEPVKISKFIIVMLVVGASFLLLGWYRKAPPPPSPTRGELEQTQSVIAGLELLRPGRGNAAEGGFDAESVLAALKNAGGAYQGIQKLAVEGLAVFGELSYLQERWAEFIFKNGGDELIASLKRLYEGIAAVNEAVSRIQSISSETFGLGVDIRRLENFFREFVPYLSSDTPHRFAVFLYNTSEMRPAGGFLGSYAEVTLKKGEAEKVEIRDINEPDRELDLKVVPPKSLQAAVKRFKAAEANWFFDFPTSAKKTLEFLEASGFNRGAAFDGAVAVTPRVIGDLLSLTGPIDIPDFNVRLDSSNFLSEIQEEVQAGQAAKSSRPKEILAKLAPLLVEQLIALDADRRRAVIGRVGEWTQDKDIMLYFKNPEFQKFFETYGLTGRVYELPERFYGGYLAVVNANIGGGKSDRFMEQEVTLQSQIGNDGVVRDRLGIVRTHKARRDEAWWYRVTNQNYLRVFAVPNAQLESASGGLAKKITPPLNYEKEGYAVDPDVLAVESTLKTHPLVPEVQSFSESGKTVFAAWTKTPAGSSSTVTFDYAYRLPEPPADGRSYQFIFEKQTGARGKYKFEIHAPVGFRFRENNLPVFEYETSDPPGRLILNLTLEEVL